jgi:hypothetical protein
MNPESFFEDGGLAEIVTENLFDKIHSDLRWLPFLRKIGKAPRPARQNRVQSAAAPARKMMGDEW